MKRIIRSVLTSGRIFKLVPDSYFIAERARDLMWNHGIVLSGGDALHVASALEAKCKEIITTDKGISDQKDIIEKLGIRVITADQSPLLPEKYKAPLFDLALNDEA